MVPFLTGSHVYLLKADTEKKRLMNLRYFREKKVLPFLKKKKKKKRLISLHFAALRYPQIRQHMLHWFSDCRAGHHFHFYFYLIIIISIQVHFQLFLTILLPWQFLLVSVLQLSLRFNLGTLHLFLCACDWNRVLTRLKSKAPSVLWNLSHLFVASVCSCFSC